MIWQSLFDIQCSSISKTCQYYQFYHWMGLTLKTAAWPLNTTVGLLLVFGKTSVPPHNEHCICGICAGQHPSPEQTDFPKWCTKAYSTSNNLHFTVHKCVQDIPSTLDKLCLCCTFQNSLWTKTFSMACIPSQPGTIRD